MSCVITVFYDQVLYFKNTMDFTFECVPLMVFMRCLFSCMYVMIMYKWAHPIEGPGTDGQPDSDGQENRDEFP